MAKFEVTRDTKCTVWHRETAIVEADSLEEAKLKFESDEIEKESAFLFEMMEEMTPAQNFLVSNSGEYISEFEFDPTGWEVKDWPAHLNKALP